ncbi:ABC transporter permease [Spirochaeta cellobiosiphila]|uniref:ABC transporter permease n=1 Tax=Spirochaeta cellobiosiphila TaxID=504483 RepID=UPI0003F50146|nr:ABC transporter permease [Spirochaeta cellobiosiphila]
MNTTGKISNLVITISVTLICAGLLLLIFSSDPIKGWEYFFTGPFQSSYSFGNLLGKTNLLLLTGMGAFIAFQGGVFNLGGEGQVYLGGLVFVAASFFFPDGFIGFTLSLFLTIVSGFLLAGLSGFLKIKWDVDELITTFLISSSVFSIVDILLGSPYLKDPDSYLIASKSVSDTHRFTALLPPSSLNTSIFVSLLLLAGLTYFLYATLSGYRLRLTGANRNFAYYGGIRIKLFTFMPLAISGAFHSLAGGIWVAGYHGKMIQSFSGGVGWNGIAVALIARKNPIAILPAAFLMAYLESASQAATIHSDFPYELGSILQGLVLLLVTLQYYPNLKGLRKKHA